jgi:hypothetical protein
MRVFIIIFFLSVSAKVLAQSVDTSSKDTSKRFMIVDAVSVDDNAKPLYVVDGVIFNGNIKKINPNDILSINIIKKDKASEYFESDVSNGVVVVVTKTGAIKTYQKKFSAFSKKYKDYIDHNKNSDDSCAYVLNGVIIYSSVNERIKKLYEIPDKEIKGVGIAENPGYNGGESRKYLVLITTKQ